jgi:uncharacterized protein (DUF1501 family)
MVDSPRRPITDPDDISRREFLQAGGLGLATCGVALPTGGRRTIPDSGPGRSAILLLLVGGPSQLETFDPKPDAPAEVRGPFQSIATRIPGIRVSEHLPRLAARMDRVALVRSVHHDAAPIHETGLQLLQTGRLCSAGEEFPHLGSVIARIVGSNRPTAASVILPGPIASTGIDIPHGQSAGCLGASFDPTFLAPYRAAFALSRESDRARDAYGRTPFGDHCLLARRLVESGVAVVTVNMYDTVFDRISWDAHGAGPFTTFDDYARTVLPTFDRAYCALLDDLERAGRLDRTLVVAGGEFGRTPRINASGGRDHWPGVWSVALAGGGIRGGQAIGASDPLASEPVDRPVALPDLLATIYRSLGIDPNSSTTTETGRPFRLIEHGGPLRELFA